MEDNIINISNRLMTDRVKTTRSREMVYRRVLMESGSSSSAGHSLPGSDDITRERLSNGLTVLSRTNYNSPSVVVRGILQAGGLLDPDEKLGLADFTASALMRGTDKYSFNHVFEILESSGASLGYDGRTHTTIFSGRALAEDLNLLLKMLSETLRRPTFPLKELERLRTQALTSLAIRSQDTGDMASMSFDEVVYADHPYRRPTEGFPETIKPITRSDIEKFHERYYGPRKMILAIVGAVAPDEAVDSVNDLLGDWKNVDQGIRPELIPITPLESVQRKRVNISGKSQTDVVIGAPGPRRQSPDFLPAALGNNILGQFGMMGRIGEVVRQQSGLAYYASSSLGGGPGPGPWAISAGVDPQNLEKAIELIIREVKRFTEEPVMDEELGDSKASIIGSLPLSLESNHGVASALVNLERYDLGLDYYRRYPDLIRSIDKENILEVARRYLDPGRLGVGIAGP